ncbi:nuclear transport factor 2 family protein [Streptomyces sp. NPDC087420]|uniref:nuclear transport factor 2 family protein n=1 Tax=Streptomyces sp. NPDC087420 TaxID=3365785 RepID=UPI0038380947
MSDERQVQQVLARYVRAADHRDGAAMSALFETAATAEIFYNRAGTPEKITELVGAEAIGGAIAGLMTPHPPRGWSHHTTHDHLIEVDRDSATIDAQFVVYNTVGDERPEGGWPPGAVGAQGTITPIESGYYRPTLRRTDGVWKISHHRVILDQPMAFPGA